MRIQNETSVRIAVGHESSNTDSRLVAGGFGAGDGTREVIATDLGFGLTSRSFNEKSSRGLMRIARTEPSERTDAEAQLLT